MRGLVNGAGLNAGVTDLSGLFRSSGFRFFVELGSSDEEARSFAGAFVFASAAASGVADRVTGRAARSLIAIVSGADFSETGDTVVANDFVFAAALSAAFVTDICWLMAGTAALSVTGSGAVDIGTISVIKPTPNTASASSASPTTTMTERCL